ACGGAAAGPGAGRGARGVREGPRGDERQLHVLPYAGAEVRSQRELVRAAKGLDQGEDRGVRGAEGGGQGVDRAVSSLLEVLSAAGDMPGSRP
ncbi:hypothetical protein V491_08391, partial [Pseudogymnoascus sp. VKM F-3775]